MAGVKGKQRVPASAPGRVCGWCHTWKEAAHFGVAKGCLRRHCRSCGNRRTLELSAANPERRRAVIERFKQRHPGIQGEYVKKYREGKRAILLPKERAWREKNKEKVRMYGHRHTAKRRGAKGHVSCQQIRDRVAFYGGRCWRCRAPYEQLDHVKPLAKGGLHLACNIRPICKSCNQRKRDKWPIPGVLYSHS